MIKKLSNLFPHADKVLHFIVGAVVALIICLLIQDQEARSQYGVAGSFLVGLGKEYRDHTKDGAGGINTWLDWFATIAGGAVVSYGLF